MEQDFLDMRLSLARERTQAMGRGEGLAVEREAYFLFCRDFLLMLDDCRLWLKAMDPEVVSLEELRDWNQRLYAGILPQAYGESYANPQVASARLGAYGPWLSFLYMEIRSIIGFVYEGNREGLAIRWELFLEVYGLFLHGEGQEGAPPSTEELRLLLYRFFYDYAHLGAMEKVGDMLLTEGDFAMGVVEKHKRLGEKALYLYGEYVAEDQWRTFRHLQSIGRERLQSMADTLSQGYRQGFVAAGKDLSKKGVVDLHYPLGFEPMISLLVENFAAMGLASGSSRNAYSLLHGPGLRRRGFLGEEPNRQCTFDHKDDRALFWDAPLAKRQLEALREAFSYYRREAALHAGPALIETFGEEEFAPHMQPEAVKMTAEMEKSYAKYRVDAGDVQREFIPEEERSFSIIAYPVPSIGPDFAAIFDATVEVNTLDALLYRDIQQGLIDILDGASWVDIQGRGGNRTRLRVALQEADRAAGQTKFENCVADVNIPVGEVFTSPRLQGTEGLLHLEKVYLFGLEYRDLELYFQDGLVADYGCSNFEDREKGRAYIKENLLFFHDHLPMGEFAIGTNTTAYAMGRRFGIEAKLPVLIAEKTGPHFAIGDTCYSHSEEVPVKNPDGREMVAKHNEKSLEGKYYNCHTDITLPYGDIGGLWAVMEDGSRIALLEEGRFVPDLAQPLNVALDSM